MMKYNPEQLRKDVITKRKIDNNYSLQEVSNLIGISKATLSRIENSKMIDVETFGKICEWLTTSPNKYFIPTINKR